MIVADSSVWIAYFRDAATDEVARLDALLDTQDLIVGDLILTEVLQGFRSDRDYRAARERMASLPVERMGGRDAVIEAADAYRTLRRRSVTPRCTIDVLIATHCIRRDHALLHADRDFDLMAPILGLRTAG